MWDQVLLCTDAKISLNISAFKYYSDYLDRQRQGRVKGGAIFNPILDVNEKVFGKFFERLWRAINEFSNFSPAAD